MLPGQCGRGHFDQLYIDEDGDITCLVCGWRPAPDPPPDIEDADDSEG